MARLTPEQAGLSNDAFDQLEEAIKGTQLVDEQIKMAQQAGIDVGNASELNRENRTKLMKVKQTYFPGR